MSAWKGYNLTELSEEYPWYKGPTLLEALNQLEPPKKPTDKPLRFAVSKVYNIPGLGIVATGKIHTGRVKIGMEVICGNNGLKGLVKSI